MAPNADSPPKDAASRNESAEPAARNPKTDSESRTRVQDRKEIDEPMAFAHATLSACSEPAQFAPTRRSHPIDSAPPSRATLAPNARIDNAEFTAHISIEDSAPPNTPIFRIESDEPSRLKLNVDKPRLSLLVVRILRPELRLDMQSALQTFPQAPSERSESDDARFEKCSTEHTELLTLRIETLEPN